MAGAYSRIFFAWIASRRFAWIICALAWIPASAARGQSFVTVSVDLASAGPDIPEGFAGLSFEANRLHDRRQGVPFFSSDNRALTGLLHALNVRTIRIGGRSADEGRSPSQTEIDDLFQFARAEKLNVIYTLRLGDGEEQADAQLAGHLLSQFPEQLHALEIGNNPGAYIKDRDSFTREWSRFAVAIHAQAPRAPLAGPCLDASQAQWVQPFLDQARSNGLTEVSQQYYPGGDNDRAMSGTIGRDLLLSPVMMENYFHLLQTFVAPANAAQLPARINACNGFSSGGIPGVSDTAAQALWGLDLLSWWGQSRAAGLCFHSCDLPETSELHAALAPGAPDAVYRDASGDSEASPLAYAIKAFTLARGKILRTSFSVKAPIGSTDVLDMTAYANLGNDKELLVTLINKQHSRPGENPAQPIQVILRGEHATVPYALAYEQTLSCPENDPAATSGLALGGKMLKNDGTWGGTWTRLPPGPFVVTLPPATAMIVKIIPGLPQARP